MAGACQITPGIKLLYQPALNSKIEFVLDSAPWTGVGFLIAACFFGWMHKQKDNQK
jgi:mannitol-specific phosphotransferase system IIBC component